MSFPKPSKHTEVQYISETIIVVEGGHYKKVDHEGKELQIIEELVKLLGKVIEGRPHQKVKQVLTQTFNNNKFIVMSFQLASNQKASITLSLVDADTLQPVTASFVGETETVDNTAVATTDPVNGLVGIAPGTGNLTSVATWTYTDKNTNQPVTVSLTTVTPFEVTQVVTAENVQQVVTLGTPVAQ